MDVIQDQGNDPRLIELYESVRRGFAARPVDHSAIVRELLSHPCSLDKLQRACRVTMKTLVIRDDLRADLSQEAALHIAERLNEGSLAFEPQGAVRFGGWLWNIWYDACRTAWRRQWRVLKRSPVSGGTLHSVPAPQAAANLPLDAWNDVVRSIRLIDDPDLQHVLTDWSQGLTGFESAQKWGLSKSTVCRLRARGIAKLQRALQQQWDLD